MLLILNITRSRDCRLISKIIIEKQKEILDEVEI